MTSPRAEHGASRSKPPVPLGTPCRDLTTVSVQGAGGGGLGAGGGATGGEGRGQWRSYVFPGISTAAIRWGAEACEREWRAGRGLFVVCRDILKATVADFH